MKMKPLAACSPLLLCLVSGAARAELEPFSFGASETVQHQSNIFHADDDHRQADWLSTTELRAALDEAIGRQRLLGEAAVDLNRYKKLKPRNSTGYDLSLELDWSTIGDLSGALGADSHRTQYLPGETDVLDPATGEVTTTSERNLQTTNHVFARGVLGGAGRWQLFAGADANNRKYSSAAYRGNEQRQWSANAGTNYSTSPDLSFGVSAGYVDGEYPHYGLTGERSNFSLRSINLNTKLQASAASAFTASVGYTSESSDVFTKDKHFVNGSLNWIWTPPSRFKVTLGLKRSSDADTGTTGVNTGVVNANNLNGSSINNVALLNVNYELTAKVSLSGSAQYTQRKYSDLIYTDSVAGTTVDVNGSSRTSRFFLDVHYQPTRTTDLSCGGGRETRHVDASLANITPSYSDNTVQCTASIRFE